MLDPSSPGVQDTLVCVSCYNDFESLAHKPRGTPAKRSLYCYHLDIHDGSLTLLSVDAQSKNPAFSRYNSKTKTLYTCTEYLEKDGELYSYRMDAETGGLTLLSKQSAKGMSRSKTKPTTRSLITHSQNKNRYFNMLHHSGQSKKEYDSCELLGLESYYLTDLEGRQRGTLDFSVGIGES